MPPVRTRRHKSPERKAIGPSHMEDRPNPRFNAAMPTANSDGTPRVDIMAPNRMLKNGSRCIPCGRSRKRGSKCDYNDVCLVCLDRGIGNVCSRPEAETDLEDLRKQQRKQEAKDRADGLEWVVKKVQPGVPDAGLWAQPESPATSEPDVAMDDDDDDDEEEDLAGGALVNFDHKPLPDRSQSFVPGMFLFDAADAGEPIPPAPPVARSIQTYLSQLMHGARPKIRKEAADALWAEYFAAFNTGNDQVISDDIANLMAPIGEGDSQEDALFRVQQAALELQNRANHMRWEQMQNALYATPSWNIEEYPMHQGFFDAMFYPGGGSMAHRCDEIIDGEQCKSVSSTYQCCATDHPTPHFVCEDCHRRGLEALREHESSIWSEDQTGALRWCCHKCEKAVREGAQEAGLIARQGMCSCGMRAFNNWLCCNHRLHLNQMLQYQTERINAIPELKATKGCAACGEDMQEHSALSRCGLCADVVIHLCHDEFRVVDAIDIEGAPATIVGTNQGMRHGRDPNIDPRLFE